MIISASACTAYILNETQRTNEQHIRNLYNEINIIAQRAEDSRLRSRVSFSLIYQDHQNLRHQYEEKCKESDELWRVGQYILKDKRLQNQQLEERIRNLETQE